MKILIEVAFLVLIGIGSYELTIYLCKKYIGELVYMVSLTSGKKYTALRSPKESDAEVLERLKVEIQKREKSN
jgi:hypothetical protein